MNRNIASLFTIGKTLSNTLKAGVQFTAPRRKHTNPITKAMSTKTMSDQLGKALHPSAVSQTPYVLRWPIQASAQTLAQKRTGEEKIQVNMASSRGMDERALTQLIAREIAQHQRTEALHRRGSLYDLPQ
ncbi:hypothetical protein [Candidatus Regiella insecticola]|uniref:hypothetical protein n=1 Tax=Candidatus Regiella insecticola TaxID=138073 RepID=UPI00159708ED|nr:hypothetical protein [Candidatus Regiella insecticola]